MHAFDEDYVSVHEAASLLDVAPSTVRRWIRQGDVPAYRIGRRRVALRRSDLTALITPIRSVLEHDDTSANNRPPIPELTIEKQQRALAAIDRAERNAKELLERRGGKLFRSSWEELNEIRDERTRQLG